MEVTSKTFAAMLPDIMDQVTSCSFVAFDCEFTALRPDPRPEMRCSLFDTMEERYRKLTGAPVPALVSQVQGCRSAPFPARSAENRTNERNVPLSLR